MASRDVVVIGASAGGIEALRAVVGAFPAGLPAAVLVVLHIPRSSPSALPRILDRSGALPASHAVNGDTRRAVEWPMYPRIACRSCATPIS